VGGGGCVGIKIHEYSFTGSRAFTGQTDGHVRSQYAHFCNFFLQDCAKKKNELAKRDKFFTAVLPKFIAKQQMDNCKGVSEHTHSQQYQVIGLNALRDEISKASAYVTSLPLFQLPINHSGRNLIYINSQ
jgi:hypothetical protein